MGTSVTMSSISGSRLKPPSVRSTRATGSATDTRVVAAPSNVVAARATAWQTWDPPSAEMINRVSRLSALSFSARASDCW